MKIRLSIMFVLLAIATGAWSQKIDKNNFPDNGFRTYVSYFLDKNSDGYLSMIEINGAKSINLNPDLGIVSLEGIEYFYALEELYCSDNDIESLDLSCNTALIELDCSHNKLTSLDVSRNTALTYLSCSGNQLTSLVVSEYSQLKKLYCEDNRLKGAAVDALIACLPTWEDNEGEFYAIAPRISTEQNVITTTQVATAKAKGWTTYYWPKDVWGGAQYMEYAGSEPPVGLAINETNFPDAIFRQWVKDHCDDGDGILTDTEIAKVEAMRIGGLSIANLKGIEYFTALKEFVCDENQLTSLDVSQNTALILMSCSGNQLTSLDVSNNTALQYFYCSENQLTSLDVSKNTALFMLYCNGNQLTSLDLSNNTQLFMLSCERNGLTSLDLSNNTMMNRLSCSSNRLTSLDVSNKILLYYLDCSGNRLTSLILTNSSGVSELYCYNNRIRGAAMDALIASLPEKSSGYGTIYAIAPYISTEGNVMTTVQVSAAESKMWETYYWSGSDWDVGRWEEYAGSKPPVGIAINETNFPDENFRAYVKAACQSDGDDILTDEEIAAVTEIYLNSSSIADLKGIEFFTALKQLSCINCSLTSLDLSNNTALDYLDCTHNSLTSLDLSNNTALKTLDCSINQLTKLDVSNNTALTTLWCADNYLTSLDLSNNTVLKSLDCSFTNLKKLDVSNNTALIELNCSVARLTSLDLSNNTALTYVFCYYNPLTSLVVSKEASSLVQIGCFYCQIKGAAMDKLVESLPDNDKDKYLYVYIIDDENEGNEMTVRQVAAAKKKKWYAAYSDSNIIDWYYYDGIDAGDTPTAIPTVTLEASSDSPFYSLDGQRIVGKPTKKGVYVRNGRKVVVK